MFGGMHSISFGSPGVALKLGTPTRSAPESKGSTDLIAQLELPRSIAGGVGPLMLGFLEREVGGGVGALV